MKYHAGTKSKVVLAIVAPIIEGGQHVFGLDEAQRNAARGAKIKTYADIGRKGYVRLGLACLLLVALHRMSVAIPYKP